MISRRTLLAGATAIISPLIVAGSCQNGVTITPQEVVTVAQNAVAALANTLTTVLKTAPTAIPGNTAANINTYLADAASVLTGLSSGMSASAGAPVVQQVEADLNAVITAAASIPLIPPPFSIALQAAAVALPILEAFINSVLPQKAAVPLEAAAARQKFSSQAPGLTQDGAKAELAKYAARR